VKSDNSITNYKQSVDCTFLQGNMDDMQYVVSKFTKWCHHYKNFKMAAIQPFWTGSTP